MLPRVIVGVGWCVQLSLSGRPEFSGRLQTESQADDLFSTARGRRGRRLGGKGGVGTEAHAERHDLHEPVDELVTPPLEAWKVKMGPQKRGLHKATMVLPAALRIATNIIGTSVLAAGYGLGAASAKLWGGKAVDSPAFAFGFKFFMLANGVFPRFEVRPIEDEDRKRLSDLYSSKHHSVSMEEVTADRTRLAPIIVSNHISYLDAGVLAWFFGAPKFVAKAGVRKVPVAGKLGEELGVIFVDRESRVSRGNAFKAIQEHCEQWAFGDQPLLVFPEGKCTNGLGLQQFKPGAFGSGRPVRPVLIVPTGPWDIASTSYKMTPEGPQKTTDLEWATQFVGHFLHTLDVIVLPPYIPSAGERADATVYAQNVQAYMASEYEYARASAGLINRTGI